MFIPGFAVSIATFPGVIVHEAAHRLFADMAHVPVYKVSYFRLGNPSGYVVHGPVKGLKNSLLISIGPLIVNTVLCSLLTFAALFPLWVLDEENFNPIFAVLAWAGISIGMHAFPSDQDMKGFLENVKNEKGKGLLYVVCFIFALILRIANGLRVIWFDLLYAIGISLLLPWLIGVF